MSSVIGLGNLQDKFLLLFITIFIATSLPPTGTLKYKFPNSFQHSYGINGG